MPNYKNIVGSGFPEYVNTQIQQRGKIISNKNRNNSTLQYLTNRNVWFRLSSSVNINNEAKTAQLNVLQGGTLAAGGNKTAIRRGFNETYSKGSSDDLGFKPMPGIINVSIDTGGKWQTLMQADIEFICYDLDQLDIMTKLYMSLGCNLFLEWGHSNYFRNDGTFEINSSPINFFSTNDKDLILKKATDKRKSTNGNYEAMLGRVHNFDWTANNDGSYNCKIKIMGPGAIVESLKINNANQVDFTIFKTIEGDSGDFSSNLENILTSYKEFFLKASPPLEIVLTGKKSSKEKKTKFAQIDFDKEIEFFTANDNKVVNKILTYRQYLNSVFLSANYKGPVILGDKITNENINIKYGNAHQIISGLQSPEAKLSEVANIPEIKANLYNGYVSSQTIDGAKNYCTYITLGHLFTLIQHLGIFTQKTNGLVKPIVYLDYNPSNTIIKTTSFKASIDPSKCLIPYDVESKTQHSFFDGILQTNNNLQEYNLLNGTYNDPPNLPGFNDQLFSVLINIDFAINTFKNLSSSSNDKEVSLMDYITRILDGVNISLGKINSFRPFFDKDSDCIRIVDENKIIRESQGNKVIEIPNFGTKSLVYDYSFNTKISPQLASQIVIASQANADELADFSENVLSYQYLNRGVEDRLAKTKLPAVDPKIRVEILSEKENKKPLEKLFKYFFNVYNDFNPLKSEKISEMTNLYVDLQGRFEKFEIISKKKKPPSAIPIEYSIKIDGISGILPYNAFRIAEDRLPKQYRNNDGLGGIDFAIFSINHSIEANKWYTILRGQIITRN